MNKIIQNIGLSASKLPRLNANELAWKNACGVVSVPPMPLPWGMFTVEANNVVIIERNGKYDGFREPGLRWAPIGFDGKSVFLGDKTEVQDNMYITDSRGNPIEARSSVTFRIVNPLNKVFNVPNNDVISRYFESQVRTTLSQFTYDELLTGSKELFEMFTEDTNKLPKMEEYGIEIQRADLLDIKYAPEIAKSMLVKQQVQATIDARKSMIDNVVEITDEINSKMGSELTSGDRSKLATYLTISMLTDKSPQMVYDI